MASFLRAKCGTREKDNIHFARSRSLVLIKSTASHLRCSPFRSVDDVTLLLLLVLRAPTTCSALLSVRLSNNNGKLRECDIHAPYEYEPQMAVVKTEPPFISSQCSLILRAFEEARRSVSEMNRPKRVFLVTQCSETTETKPHRSHPLKCNTSLSARMKLGLFCYAGRWGF
jgi:hypothetical protein